MNRKLKKYNLRYEYLKLEEEDVREVLGGYIEEFDSIFKKYYQTPPPIARESQREVWVNEETGEVRDTPPPNFVDDINEEFERSKKERERKNDERLAQLEELKNRPAKIKKLYKKLAVKTHPDRGGSNYEFQMVNDAYESNNLMWLLTKAGEYGLEYDIDDSDETILSKNLDKLESEIKRMKNTMAWSWGSGNADLRKAVLSKVEAETGWKIPSEDLPNDLKSEINPKLLDN